MAKARPNDLHHKVMREEPIINAAGRNTNTQPQPEQSRRIQNGAVAKAGFTQGKTRETETGQFVKLHL